MMSNKKPLLPSLATLLTNESQTHSAPTSPFLDQYKNNFRSDDRGIIRLPPLASSINRPKSVESAIRQSATYTTKPSTLLPTPDHSLKILVQQQEPLLSTSSPKSIGKKFSLNSPTTPIIKTKHSSYQSKKIDMLTPLTAVKASITPSSNDKKRSFAFITHSQDTFGVKEPKIDNAPLARRKRRRTSIQELNILQAGFENCATPDKKQRSELADRCNMTEKAVQIWFQNKRQAVKRQRNSLAKLNTDLPSSDNNIHSTPIAPRVDDDHSDNQTPHLQTPHQDGEVTPTRKSSSKDSSPTRRSPTPTRGRGQALTFHLKTDKKILTPLKTSPNNKVNKLINGYNNSILHKSPTENRFSSTKTKKVKLEFKSSEPLKELNTNIIKS